MWQNDKQIVVNGGLKNDYVGTLLIHNITCHLDCGTSIKEDKDKVKT